MDIFRKHQLRFTLAVIFAGFGTAISSFLNWPTNGILFTSLGGGIGFLVGWIAGFLFQRFYPLEISTQDIIRVQQSWFTLIGIASLSLSAFGLAKLLGAGQTNASLNVSLVVLVVFFGGIGIVTLLIPWQWLSNSLGKAILCFLFALGSLYWSTSTNDMLERLLAIVGVMFFLTCGVIYVLRPNWFNS